MARINKFNDWLALHATMVFGSMYVCYLFFLYAFIPLIFPHYQSDLLYWSNTVQLWSLPLLMVGQNVMGRGAEKQAKETHDDVVEELSLLKDNHLQLHDKVSSLQEGIESIKEATCPSSTTPKSDSPDQ